MQWVSVAKAVFFLVIHSIYMVPYNPESYGSIAVVMLVKWYKRTIKGLWYKRTER